MMFSLNVQLGILSTSLLIVAVTLTAPVLFPKNSTANPQTPLERLLSQIPIGCIVINQTRVSPSIFNPELHGVDTAVVVQCVE
jgi:hypothetical protein